MHQFLIATLAVKIVTQNFTTVSAEVTHDASALSTAAKPSATVDKSSLYGWWQFDAETIELLKKLRATGVKSTPGTEATELDSLINSYQKRDEKSPYNQMRIYCLSETQWRFGLEEPPFMKKFEILRQEGSKFYCKRGNRDVVLEIKGEKLYFHGGEYGAMLVLHRLKQEDIPKFKVIHDDLVKQEADHRARAGLPATKK